MVDLNDQQQLATAFIDAFVAGPDRMARLDGYAGTGKTTVIGYWLEANRHSQRVCFATPTWPALEVGKEKCVRAGIQDGVVFSTLHSLLGITIRYDRFGDPQRRLSGTRTDDRYTLIIADECSMIDNFVFDVLATSPAKVLFVGDSMQLPPVKKKRGVVQPSPTFSVPNYVSLTRIMRQQEGSPIIGASTRIRELMKTQGYVIRDDIKNIVATGDARCAVAEYAKLHESLLWCIQQGMNSVILAWDNKTVRTHNEVIHQALYPGTPLFGVGEIARVKNTVYNDATEQPLVKNNDVVKVLECSFVGDAFRLGVDVYRIIAQRDDATLTLHVPASEDSVEARLRQLKDAIKEIDKVVGQLQIDEAKAELGSAHRKQVVERIKTLTEGERESLRQHRVRLQSLVILRHSYAMTVHKAQGATLDAVLVDWPSVGASQEARMTYTAMTRPSKILVFFV